ncbi:hypothetical protein [Thalassomonas actiniarum]|nr:hypothetical protein [Thalassomonas actiniarum]
MASKAKAVKCSDLALLAINGSYQRQSRTLMILLYRHQLSL